MIRIVRSHRNGDVKRILVQNHAQQNTAGRPWTVDVGCGYGEERKVLQTALKYCEMAKSAKFVLGVHVESYYPLPFRNILMPFPGTLQTTKKWSKGHAACDPQ